MSEWYDDWFSSPWYLRLYQHRSEQEAQQAVGLIERVAGIEAGASILDLACGYGRHALALAEAGYNVCGLDNSPRLIEMAKEQYAHHRVSYIQGDMRGPLPVGPYDAVVSFFTSFGYFDTVDEDRKAVEAAASVLKPNGVYLLDFLNATELQRTLEPESMSILSGITVIQERSIVDGVVVKDITINDPCTGEVTFQERVRLYTRDELVAMIESTGMTVDNVMGSYTAEPFDNESSKRCIILAHKS